jgi:uncharacterized membrane protein YhfC
MYSQGGVLILSGILEIIIPLAFSIYIIRRLKIGWKTWIVGAGMFILSLIRIPLNQYLSQVLVNSMQGSWTFLILALIPSTMAGVFEEVSRFVGIRYIINDDTYEKGLVYGAGHGGIESIVLVGINVLVLGVLVIFSPQSIPPSQLEQILANPVYLPLLGVYERVMVIMIQVAFSILVLEFIRKKEIKYFLAALFSHILLNFFAVVLSRYSIIYSELSVTFFAIALGYWLYRKMRSEKILEKLY